ncbi:cysteine--tRNA ligase [Timonella senegalensis]|uniref:cysteine--tRNA ligase n=1 Tax=Timonella senegalensis TaxID=1465825 RepID=UPI00058D5462|nr:cysteine--tRNA ligase [Timonella senegalensis]
MTLRLFDTATRQVRTFEPRVTGKVGMYVCGATVQAPPHIGHMRSAVAFDVLVRWLKRTGLDVTYIRNVTDIDDKIISKSAANDTEWWAWAAIDERAFTDAYDALGNLRPTFEPHATAHILDMIELMDRLVERGHAYQAGEGNVYFDTRSWQSYGSLTNQQIDDALPSEDEDEVSLKRDPRDFALWKAAKPAEPATAQWPTPYGTGRPGWHLECSAMAKRYLGEAFDIHGGGLDLRFPHHENEQAQSKAAGYDFANFWMHSAWVTQGGTKMSKSLGNGLLVSEVLENTRAAVLRYALATVHYRSMLEWTPDTVADANAMWDRFSGFVDRASEVVGDVSFEEVAAAELPAAFTDAMNDDLNVSVGLAVVHEHLKAGNSALASGDTKSARTHLVALRAMLDTFGLDPAAWSQEAGDDKSARALDSLVASQIQARVQARKDRDFATADAIRDSLAAAGIVVEDSATGARWSLA